MQKMQEHFSALRCSSSKLQKPKAEYTKLRVLRGELIY